MQPGQIHGFAVFLGCGQYLVALQAVASETDVYPCAVPALTKFEYQLDEFQRTAHTHFKCNFP